MAKDSDPLADAFGAKETGGLFSGLLAEESAVDRSMMWRLGAWGVVAVGAVVMAGGTFTVRVTAGETASGGTPLLITHWNRSPDIAAVVLFTVRVAVVTPA